MARLTFPSDRLVYASQTYAGTAFTSAAGQAAVVYSDAAGSTLADVQNLDGSANAAATFTVDTTSRLPLFLGPASGSGTLYVKIGTGPVNAIYAVTATSSVASPVISPALDAYTARVLDEVSTFTAWLTANGQKGYFGEWGSPSDRGDDNLLWAAQNEAFYQVLDAYGMWATPWVASENTPYHMLGYYSVPAGATATGPLSTPTAAAQVLEAHPSKIAYLRGINLGNSGENGCDYSRATGQFSNAREYPGWSFAAAGSLIAAASGAGVPENNQASLGGKQYAQIYNYGSLATFQYLASRGIKLIRLPFRWERMQRTLGGALDATELARYDQAIAWIKACGMQAVVDCHNFGFYYQDDGSQGVAKSIGGAVATNAMFADLWGRLATHYAAETAVAAFGLCNEPTNATNWTSTSGPAAAAVTAIRATAATQYISVSGPGYGIPHLFTGLTPWVTDPLNKVLYEAHFYWDYVNGNTASFEETYASEVASAVAAGFGPTNSRGLLASVKYDPAVYTQKTTTAFTVTNLDTTNLKVKFVAPPSGIVVVRLSALAGAAGATNGYWGLANGTTEVARSTFGFYAAASTADFRTAVELRVTGLVPYQAYTWNWFHAAAGNGVAVKTTYGDGATGNPAVIEVFAG